MAEELMNQTLRTPIPDPTTLTTQQLIREVSSLREMIEAKIDSQGTNIETRFEAMDRAIMLLQAKADKEPSISLVDQRITGLQEVHSERFKSIQVQFIERDTRTEQTSRDSKVAVDAALQAAKEAVGEQNKSSASAISKSEAATTKQIDQLGLLISANSTAIDGKIMDVKERVTRIEGTSTGGKDVLAWVATGLMFLLTLSVSVASIYFRSIGR